MMVLRMSIVIVMAPTPPGTGIVSDILQAAPSVKEIRLLETIKRPEPAPEPESADETPAE
jgi:hypothetical protein